MELSTIWYILFLTVLAIYCILDGFDLGVGVVCLFTKSLTQRQHYLKTIGPLWDGNEVWLLTGGGALFAAFPVAYATLFSSLYGALMLLLLALIFRAVALEFMYQGEHPRWIGFWSRAFGVSSLVPALLFGVAVGNVIRGLPLDESQTYTGTFFQLLNPYALLCGVLSLTWFTMHGLGWLAIKTKGAHVAALRTWTVRLWIAVVALALIVVLATYRVANYTFGNQPHNWGLWLGLLLLAAGLIAIPVFLRRQQYVWMFLASSLGIVACFVLVAAGLFPKIIPSNTDLSYSLTITQACSTPQTLKTMLIITLIGLPLVLLYTAFIYRTFAPSLDLDTEQVAPQLH